MIYAGIGSRKTPEDVCRKMRSAATSMARMGFTLRSGAAEGADEAFESGAIRGKGSCEIYLPYKFFRKHESPLYDQTFEARQIAKKYHPKWEVLGNTGRAFMARNAYQILGTDLKTPVDFVLCWTENGKIKGGTGQAMRHAKDLGIKILNFATDSDEDINNYITSLHEWKNK